MLSAQDPIVTRVLDDVRATLDRRWQGYELTFTGSLAAGLGTIESDIDLAVHLPNSNASAGLYVLQETDKLFNKQPELYSGIKYKHNAGHTSSFLQLHHIASERTVDIEFQTGDLDILEAKLMKYYFDLDRRFKPLTVFLKYWSFLHEVTGHDGGSGRLPGYALYLLVIFYLQRKNMAPPGYVLQVNSTTHYIDDWSLGLNELPYSTTNTENLYQLLGGFFKYYSEFNFEEYIVSPFTGRPIPKNAFIDFDNFPEVYTLYHSTWNRIVLRKIMNTEISIQDFLGRHINAAFLVSYEQASTFKYLMKSMATMFVKLPSDKVLRAILDTGDNKNTIINHNNSTDDGINYQNCNEMELME